MSCFVPGLLQLYRRYMEGFMTRGWDLFLARCGRTSTLAPGTTLAARWLYDPEPIRNQCRCGWGIHLLRGGVDPEDIVFLP